MDWLNNLLSDKKLMRDLKSGVSYAIPFILILIYWSFLDNFVIRGIDFRKIGALAFIYGFSLYVVRIDIKSRAKEDEIKENEELEEVEKAIGDINFDVKNDNIGIEFVRELNANIQKKANLIKTEKEIEKIKFTIRKRISKDKDTTKLENQIEELENNHLFDKKILPIKYTTLIYPSTNGKKDNDIVDGKGLDYDPAKDGNIRSLGFTFIKGIGAGGVGLAFLWSEPLQNVIAYLLLLIFGIISTTVTQYPLTRYKTKGEYYAKRKRKLNLMKEMEEYIIKNELKEADIKKIVEETIRNGGYTNDEIDKIANECMLTD